MLWFSSTLLIDEVPDPGSYESPTDFSANTHKLPAYSFGASYKTYKKVMIGHKVDDVDESIPGPGSYKVPSSIGREGWKITMGVGQK